MPLPFLESLSNSFSAKGEYYPQLAAGRNFFGLHRLGRIKDLSH